MAINGLKTWASSDALSTTNLNNDKTVLEAKFNAGITTADLSASAGIVNAQLANSIYELIVTMEVRPTTAVAPPTHATDPVAIVPFPGTTTDGGAYTILSGAYAIRAAGSGGSTTFLVQLGSYSVGTWTNALAGNIVNSTTITGGTENQSGGLTITTSALTLHASTQYHFGLILTGLGTSALDEAHKGLSVSLKLKRTSGLRS